MCSLIALFRRALPAVLLIVPLALAHAASAQAPQVGSTNGTSERAPVRIGVSGPFSGPSSPMGLSMRTGIRIATAELNAAGGVLGRRIELVERDDEASNELGAQIARDFVNRERVVAGLGIVNTGVALASQRHYQNARIPVITSVATGTLITRQFQPPEFPQNYVFRVSANDTLQAAVIADEAVVRRGFTRLAILHDASNYGVLGSADLAAALRGRGVEPVAVERFQLRQTDMQPQLERARAAGAQAVLTYGIGPELAHIANGMARMQWKVPIIGSWTLAMSNFIEIAGRNAEGARMPQTFIQAAHTPKQSAFLEAWQKATGSTRIPVPPAAAQGYDSMLLLAAAIRQAGSVEGTRIREALENLQALVDGVVMTYHRPFSADNHETLHSTQQIHLGEIRNGEVVFAREGEPPRNPLP
ncbi:ABC transporter substrate-binding protein [Thauera sp. JM12B12]|uniref:ABC transporter substrate-binding protein n=1 Tax=Thauera sp. JM12B12 TaxID=3142262 RepID=UPI0031F375F0